MSRVNTSKGNMYEWVTHTWSPGIGCPHQCSYCYVKTYREQPSEFRLDLPFPKLGKGRKIFVGHLCDMWAKGVASEDIGSILGWCSYFANEYIFQSKNPYRFADFVNEMPSHAMYGTTIETNKQDILDKLSKAPPVKERTEAMKFCKPYGFRQFVTIEPIIDFDVDKLARLIIDASPDWVNIGADSKHHNLPEPPKEKVIALIETLVTEGIKILNKSNLQRLYGSR
jgi:DNA repair photolyase